MGSGKSTYGQELANILGLHFRDLDEEIETMAGMSVAAIFEQKGETYFRELETQALMATAPLQNLVVATGGGTPCFNHQINWMNENGTTVYLKLFEAELYRRLAPEQTIRPLLKDFQPGELREFIYNTLRKRAYYYQQAQIVIDPLGLKPEQLAEILKAGENDYSL